MCWMSTRWPIPDYDGNGMYRSWGNVVVKPRCGVAVLGLRDSEASARQWHRGGSGETIRCATSFRVRCSSIRVKATRIFPNCPRYNHKMQFVEYSTYAPAPGSCFGRCRPGKPSTFSRTRCQRVIEPARRCEHEDPWHVAVCADACVVSGQRRGAGGPAGRHRGAPRGTGKTAKPSGWCCATTAGMLDERKFDEFGQLFAADGEYVSGNTTRGPAAIADSLRRIMTSNSTGPGRAEFPCAVQRADRAAWRYG